VNLKNQTLGVKITESDAITLPAAEGVPPLRVAKAVEKPAAPQE